MSLRIPRLATEPTAVVAACVLAALVAVLAFPEVASAYALVGRKDLPVPAWLFARLRVIAP